MYATLYPNLSVYSLSHFTGATCAESQPLVQCRFEPWQFSPGFFLLASIFYLLLPAYIEWFTNSPVCQRQVLKVQLKVIIGQGGDRVTHKKSALTTQQCQSVSRSEGLNFASFLLNDSLSHCCSRLFPSVISRCTSVRCCMMPSGWINVKGYRIEGDTCLWVTGNTRIC